MAVTTITSIEEADEAIRAALAYAQQWNDQPSGLVGTFVVGYVVQDGSRSGLIGTYWDGSYVEALGLATVLSTELALEEVEDE